MEDDQEASTSAVNISRFDVSKHLDKEEVIADYINAALEEGDSDLLMVAIVDVAKARAGDDSVAIGMDRCQSYQSPCSR
ncbi:DNA-binding protein [Trinickia dinghuensis]|uniref:helix-turn-helix domain-containing transcriptional regulator n=1 Tax=Trinickia dinghuensis TaxID=2291023 RepID=UPI0011C03992|nr:hypothetical protein [Trinickia dinghuensis]